MSQEIINGAILANGVRIPWLGFGLYDIPDGHQVEAAVSGAIAAGYRSFDSATLYGNEQGVGRALRDSGIPRRELFVTSKAWNNEQGYEQTLAAVERSLDRLGLDYLDLYLLHWPVPGKYLSSWRALERLHQAKRIRAIGVSNFQRHHLRILLAHAKVRPVLNQVEIHPNLPQEALRRFCTTEDVQLAAWSPLKHGKILNQPALAQIGRKYGKTPAQVILRWLFQRGIVSVPKAATLAHARENAQIHDFHLTHADFAAIAGLDTRERIGPDPDLVDYSSDNEFIRIFQGWKRELATAAV